MHIYIVKCFTIIRLINISFASHNYHFVVKVITLKLYFHSNVQIYNILLLTIVTMLHIMTLEFIHRMTQSLYLVINMSHFPHLSAPDKHYSVVSMSFFFLDFSYNWDHIQYLSFLVWFIMLNIMPLMSTYVASYGGFLSF